MNPGMTRTVQFMEVQDAEDLYRCRENGKVYVRQQCDNTHVRWLTSIKWTGGYEASGPLKAGITMRVVDGSDNILFEERLHVEEGYCETVADKAGGFSWEEIKKIGATFLDLEKLRSYNEWKMWMEQAAKEYQYTGYLENWMWCEVEYEKPFVLAKAEYLGKTAYVTFQKATHTISGQTWIVFEVRDNSKLDVLHICGYKFEGEKR